jgi:cell division protein FtsB
MDRQPARRATSESVADERDRRVRARSSGHPNPSGHPQGASTSLADLPVAGLTRRRIALIIGALVAAWVLVQFARQVGDASAAVARADAVRASNDALSGEVAALQRELSLVAQRPYVTQQARRYRLGAPDEIPFRLADDAPPLPSNAPGTAAVKLGAATERRTPLESWLELLLGAPAPPAL